MLQQIFAGRAIFLDRARRAYVIRGDRVAEKRENARPRNVRKARRLTLHTVEVRGPPDVGGAGIPSKCLSLCNFDSLPFASAFENIAVASAEIGRHYRTTDGARDFLRRRPKLPQIHRRTL